MKVKTLQAQQSFAYKFTFGTLATDAADVSGCSAWVIDYPVFHKSGGSVGTRTSDTELDFYPSRQRLLAKYNRAFRLRKISTTCTRVVVPEAMAKSWYGRFTLALQNAVYKMSGKNVTYPLPAGSVAATGTAFSSQLAYTRERILDQ